MKIICCCCGRQAVDYKVSNTDRKHLTTIRGARAGFKAGECFCGECAKDMDSNGLFPDEAYIAELERERDEASAKVVVKTQDYQKVKCERDEAEMCYQTASEQVDAAVMDATELRERAEKAESQAASWKQMHDKDHAHILEIAEERNKSTRGMYDAEAKQREAEERAEKAESRVAELEREARMVAETARKLGWSEVLSLTPLTWLAQRAKGK
jgi:hypothetical protein